MTHREGSDSPKVSERVSRVKLKQRKGKCGGAELKIQPVVLAPKCKS